MWRSGNDPSTINGTIDTKMENKQGYPRGPEAHYAASDQGGNNNVYPLPVEYQSAVLYSQLDDASRAALLHHKGYLFGVRIDNNGGPRRGTRQAARYTSNLPLSVQESNDVESEVTITESDRDTNYVHKGWLLSALPDKSPWISSRISRSNHQGNPRGRRITKHIMIPKLRVELSVKDLSPIEELENDFREALNQRTRSEKSDAVYRAFEHWGDVIPLVFDIGVSLTVTDSEVAAKNYLGDRSYLGLQRLSMSATARPSTRGGSPTMLQSEDNIRDWLSKAVPPFQWEQIRVIKTIPITAILGNELQSKLTKLHESLTVYRPTFISTIVSEGVSFDGTAYAFNTICGIAVSSDPHHIKSISTTYITDPSPITHGSVQKTGGKFDLRHGEYITDLLLWKDHKGICGIQLSTSQGRASRHFGSGGGSPQILRSSGGCLSAFSGLLQNGIIYELQTIWRHDVQGSRLSGDRELSQYLGGTGGSPFNDWPFVQHSDSAHISGIRVKCASLIDGIQVSYKDYGSGADGSSENGNYHGGSAVTGRHKKYIDQLCFTTSKGRKSNVFGGGGGDLFRCEAPRTRDGRATRLHYICGKSASLLDALIFIWAPL
ncbi:hypothetical protein RSOLAG1IB_07717 [Rhizoctonia solani AG-1 IB]|uniref:Jacalin-type lectin domain-containing protein n=1 Tax=Thanatephorus cucumeris (strain AG1-IB / isolate 7/3/14) TaxID=1108050 RepID=A0A0B7FE26_THACB|nr:hypothetical protein RSOLAG1IB_07717 [Rhizoctonia solani AG-1 IB]